MPTEYKQVGGTDVLTLVHKSGCVEKVEIPRVVPLPRVVLSERDQIVFLRRNVDTITVYDEVPFTVVNKVE